MVLVDGLHIARMLQFVYPHGPSLEGVAGAFLRVAREFRDQRRGTARAARAVIK